MDSTGSAKILKTILSIGVFIWLVYFNVTHSTGWSITAFSSALLLTALLYILMTLFGFILAATKNYFIAIVVFLGVVIFAIFKLEEIPLMSPVAEWGSLLVACIFALYLLRRDIRYLMVIKHSVSDGNVPQGKTNDE